MAFKFRQFVKGILTRGVSSDPSDNLEGSLWYNNSDGYFKGYINGAVRAILDQSSTQTVTNKVIDADINTITNIDNDEIKAAAAIELSKLAATANANRVLISDGSGIITSSTITTTELGNISGLSSNVQDQLDAKLGDIGSGTNDRLTKIASSGEALAETGISVDASDNVTGINNLTVDGDLTVSGTTTTVNSNILDVKDANVTVNKGGDQSSADAVDAGITVEMSDADNAIIGYDSTLTSKWKAGEVGSASEVITSAGSQTISGAKKFSDQIDVDNINVNGNNISSTDTDGNVNIIPNGDGEIDLQKDVRVRQNVSYDISTDTASGAATLSDPSTKVVRLTNGSLTSVDEIPAGKSGQEIVLINATGNTVIITNDASTSTTSILTGTGANVELKDEASIPLVYDNTEQRWMVSAGTGSGSGGSGGINYITNSQAETNTDGWVAYADAAAEAPVDGTGGSPGFVLTRGTGSSVVLRGDGDFVMQKIATSNIQGQGVSTDFTIANSDKSSKMYVKFDYNASDANINDGDFRVYVYDITNTNLIELDVRDLSAGNGTYFGTWQSASDSKEYRLILHIATTSTDQFTFRFDNVKVGPVSDIALRSSSTARNVGEVFTHAADGQAPIGSLHCDGAEISRTQYRKLFDVIGTTYGTGDGSTTFNIPDLRGEFIRGFDDGRGVDSGRTIGSAQGDSTARPNSNFTGSTNTTGNHDHNIAAANPGATTNTGRVLVPSTRGSTRSEDTSTAGNHSHSVTITGGGDSETRPRNVAVKYYIQYDDFGADVAFVDASRPVHFFGKGISNSNLADGGNDDITFSTIETDSHASWSSDTFTVPRSGEYIISAFMNIFVVSPTAGELGQMSIRVDGASVGDDVIEVPSTTSNFNASHKYTLTKKLTKGQEIKLNYLNEWGESINFNNSSDRGFLSIYSPGTNSALIDSQANVNARYTSNSGQSIPNNSITIVDFEDKSWDTHGLITTGSSWKFTASQYGKYRVNASVSYNATGLQVGETLITYVYKNGTTYARNRLIIMTSDNSASAARQTVPISATVELKPGDYVDVRTYHNNGAATPLRAEETMNYIEIEKID